MNQARHHHKEVLIAYKNRQAAAGARLVKKDTGVTVGKNKPMANKSPMKPQYNGDNSNLDNRLPPEQNSNRFFGKRVNKNI